MERDFINIMNVKFSENAVTFKITEQELNYLLTGDPLEQTLSIGPDDFSMSIDPNASETSEGGHAAMHILWDRPKARLSLRTTSDQIRELSAMGKSREGLSAHLGGMDVFLQVDVRKDSREKQARL